MLTRLTALSRQGIVALYLLLSLGPLFLLAYLSVRLGGDAVRDHVQAHLVDLARANALYVRQNILDVADLVDSYTMRPNLLAALAGGDPARYDHVTLDASVSRLCLRQPELLFCFLADQSGRLVAMSPANPDSLGKDSSSRDWYRGVVATGRPYVSEVYQSEYPGQPLSVAVAAPILASRGGADGLIAILGATVEPDALAAGMRDVSNTTGLSTTVIDQRGHVVTRIGPEPNGSVALDPGRLPAAFQGPAGLSEHVSGGQEVITAYAPVPELSWTVLTELPSSLAYADVSRLRLTVFAITAALTVVLLAGAWVLNRSLKQRYQEGERLKQVLAVLPAGVTIIDGAGRVLLRNPAADEALGTPRPRTMSDVVAANVPRRLDGSAYAPDQLPIARALHEEIVRGEQVLLRNSTSGRDVPMLVTSAPLRDPGGKIVGAVSGLQDITVLKEAEGALRASQARLQAILDSALDAVIILDASGRITDWNPRAEAIFGWSRQDAIGRKFMETIVPPDLGLVHADDIQRFLTSGEGAPINRLIQVEAVHRHGHRFPIEISLSSIQVQGANLFTAFVRDISERKRAEKALEHQALHDTLTDLPNRTLLQDRLEQAIRSARRGSTSVSLLLMDLDHFKEVNDTFGHQVGDGLLRQAGPRIAEKLRSTDTVARLGGDEFAVILPEVDAAGATQVAQKILKALERPFLVDQHPVELAASIGIAVWPQDGEDPDSLLRHADIAMYVAKNTRDSYALYSSEQDQHTPSRLALMAGLRRAVEEGELVLHYQPLVSVKTGRVLSMEALVRWQHPERGLLPPSEFIPLAERTGLIKPLSDWVLHAALAQGCAWHAAGRDLRVAVNLSVRNLLDPKLPDTLGGLLLARSDVNPAWLTLEITESVLMADPERAMNTLLRLRRLGMRLAIDDFGTGYSSLNYLQRLPVDEVKIDRSFVMGMVGEESSAAIVRATIDLAHTLGFEVVAEGVENQRTWDLLLESGCDIIQGFYVSRPMPASAVEEWLDRKSTGTLLSA